MLDKVVISLPKRRGNCLVAFNNGGKWVRPWIKNDLGVRNSVTFIKDANGIYWWSIPRSRFQDLVNLATAQANEVSVWQWYCTTKKCTQACLNAKGLKCDCSCLNANHGSGGNSGIMWTDIGGGGLVDHEWVQSCRSWKKQVNS